MIIKLVILECLPFEKYLLRQHMSRIIIASNEVYSISWHKYLPVVDMSSFYFYRTCLLSVCVQGLDINYQKKELLPCQAQTGRKNDTGLEGRCNMNQILMGKQKHWAGGGL